MSQPPPQLGPVERTKIQAEVLVPLIKHLEAELGVARAHDLVRAGVGARFRAMARQAAKATPPGVLVGSAGTRQMFGDALEFEIVQEDEDVAAFNVTACGFARFFQEIGEPDLGFLLVCSADYAIADGAGIALERTSTLMQGGPNCDFRWLLTGKPTSGPPAA
jgi:hypothetical protein